MRIVVESDEVVVDGNSIVRSRPKRPWHEEPELKKILLPLASAKAGIALFSKMFCQKAALDYREKYLTKGFWGSPMRFPQTTSSFACGNFAKLVDFEGPVILVSTSFLSRFESEVCNEFSCFEIELGEKKSNVSIRCLNT